MSPPTAAEPEDIAGRYQVIQKLGAGAFGTVYKVRDKTLGRMLAIKVIRFDSMVTQGSNADALKERFMREARVSAQLKHPNIVTIYDVGDAGGLSYLAMEVIDGVGLDTLILKEGRLPLARAASIGAQVADALAFAHKSNIVHRDIKPPNIMIESGDRVKVTDFGIAKVTNNSDQLTMTGSIVGTPSYMSPEQARGQTLDGRSDLFSVGCVFYEMLTGRRAFESETLTGLLFKIITEDPPPIRELEPSVPDAAVQILAKALAKTPAARYQSGGELAEELRALAYPSTPRTVVAPAPSSRRSVGPPAATLKGSDRTVGPPPRAHVATRIDEPRSRAGLWIGLGLVAFLGFATVAGLGFYYLAFRTPAEAPSPSSAVPSLAAAPSPAASVKPAEAAPASSPQPSPIVEAQAASPEAPPATQAQAPPPSSLAPVRLQGAKPARTPAPPPGTLPPPSPRPVLSVTPSKPPLETTNGQHVADAYRHGAGATLGTHGGRPREREPRDTTPVEKPAVASLRRMIEAEAAFKGNVGHYGSVADLVRANLLNVIVRGNGFVGPNYRFELSLTKDGFSVTAAPHSGSGRHFAGDEAGFIYVDEP
jgi:serine/threonine protein kinase